jgi:hypothetical protein
MGKYRKLVGVLGLKKNEAILVVSDLSEESFQRITAINHPQVLDIQLLNQALARFFEQP